MNINFVYRALIMNWRGGTLANYNIVSKLNENNGTDYAEKFK